MDIKQTQGADYQVWIDNGNRCIDESLAERLEKVAHYAVGELYLNSMDRDGMGRDRVTI